MRSAWNRAGRGGSVLIMALWALLLMTAAVLAWLKFTNVNVAITGDRNAGLQAKGYAHSGVMVALDPDVTQLTPLLNQQFSATQGYSVQLTGEGGKLNLNWLFANPQQPDPGRLALFDRYLERRGLNYQQRARLSDCILDWLTPGDVPRLNGAKESADYHPPGRGVFLSVDELAQVKGSEPLVSQAGWKDDFTIFTNPGLVDLQWASRLVLEVLPNVGDEKAARFIQYRQGPDGLDGTADDHIFTTAASAYSMLGVSGAQMDELANYAMIEYPLSMVHIRSVGQCGNVYRQLEVVARKQGLQPIILSWKEL